MRQGCCATKRKCSLDRIRFGSLIVSMFLSIFVPAPSRVLWSDAIAGRSLLRLPGLTRFTVIKCQAKGIAKGGESTLGCVCFSRFERKFVGLSGARRFGFAATRSLSHDGDVAGPHADAHFCDIGRFMIRAPGSAPHAAAC